MNTSKTAILAMIGSCLSAGTPLPLVAAEVPPGPKPLVPAGGKAPGDYPNFTVTGANFTMDASGVTDFNGGLRHEIKLNIDGQGPLPWSLTGFGQGRFTPRLNVADPQAAASNLDVLPFDIIIDGSSYEWENDLDPWAANGAAWRPHPGKGLLFASPRKNGQIWNDGEPRFYGVMSIPVELSEGEGYSMIDGTFGPGDMEIAVGKVGPTVGGSIDTSVAWFPYDQGWLGGHVATADFEQGEWLKPGFHHPDLPEDPSELITWSRELGIILPPVTVRLPEVNARTDGMLFATSIERANSNTRLTGVDPRTDGSGWDIMIRTDTETDPDFGEEVGLSFAFLYVSYGSGNLIGGHVRGKDANVINGRGNYAMTRKATGQYELAIPGKKSSDGMLLLQATGRIAGRSGTISRSFLSYEPTADDRFTIESRVFDGESDQPLADTDFYFVWVDFARPLSPPGFETVIEPPSISRQPALKSIPLGASHQFGVTAAGSEPFIYQWLFNGQAIKGATEPTYSLENATLEDAGLYVVEITNGGGKVASDPATLKVLAPPHISTHPQSVDATVGEAIRFTVTATGTEPLTYQWQKDGVNVPGATAADLLLTNIGIADAGQYRVEVRNEVKTELTLSARLTVRAGLAAPQITEHPQDAEVKVGGSASFRVMASGNPAPSYQWQFNRVNLSGQTEPNLTLSDIQPSQQGEYRVMVSNSSGSLTSRSAELVVTAAPPKVDPPIIVQQPASLTLTAGEVARFQTIVTGSMLEFQWFKDGSSLAGATQGTLIIEGVSETHVGTYQLKVRNPAATLDSASVRLELKSELPPENDGLAILTHPMDQTVPPGTDVTFLVEVGGNGTISYQWQWGDFNIPGARLASFTIANVQEVDEGEYRVVISDGDRRLTSQPATLTVSTAPVILVPPQSQSIVEGDRVTFQVQAKGASPLSYQWRYNGINLPGARSQSFTVTAVSPTDEGAYQVVVTDSGGSTVSEPAQLTVTERPSNPLLRLSKWSRVGTTLVLEWDGGPGIVLQAKARLQDPVWQDVPGTQGASRAEQLTLGAAAYFRLIQR